MQIWPGGPCPGCGEEMPAKMVHCRECRTLLNPDLSDPSVHMPVFEPLEELNPADAEPGDDVEPRGEYTPCPACGEELRVAMKYAGKRVACKHCDTPLTADDDARRRAFYADCPHCEQEIRVAAKYAGKLVGCKKCGGALRVIP